MRRRANLSTLFVKRLFGTPFNGVFEEGIYFRNSSIARIVSSAFSGTEIASAEAM